MQSSILPTYKRSNLSFVKGKGSYLITKNGKKYLDFVSGIAVNSLGHCNSELIKVLHNQSKKIYLFDDKLNLVESFPIYSISNIDLDNIDKDQNLELILTEDENSIKLYEINN